MHSFISYPHVAAKVPCLQSKSSMKMVLNVQNQSRYTYTYLGKFLTITFVQVETVAYVSVYHDETFLLIAYLLHMCLD